MRVVLAEDVALLREGLTRVLGDFNHEVVASVGSASEVLGAVREFSPDLLITDIRMPPTNTDDGLRAALDVRAKISPKFPVMVLSQYIETHYASLLLGEGSEGVGYLLKDRVMDIKSFIHSIEEVAAGGTVIDPEVIQSLMMRVTDAPLATLTAREREILALMAQGKSNLGIAEVLFINESSVEKHISNILSKLGIVGESSNHRRVLAAIRYLQNR
ncbi:MAG: response regulator transcription factor [Actinomycetota bacterium]